MRSLGYVQRQVIRPPIGKARGWSSSDIRRRIERRNAPLGPVESWHVAADGETVGLGGFRSETETHRVIAGRMAGQFLILNLERSLRLAWRTVAERARQFDDVLDATGRDPATIDRYLMLDPVCPVYSLSSADYFAEAVGRAAEHGFTDVVTHWPRATSWFAGDEAVLETVAADVLPKL